MNRKIMSSTPSCKFFNAFGPKLSVNIMTFESILGVFLFKTGMIQRIKN